MLESRLLRPPPARSYESPAAWWAAVRDERSARTSPIDRAMAAAQHADRIGWAFAVGYAQALRALVPELPGEDLAALAVTEAGGNHPRAIATTLRRNGERVVLDGEKRWVTLGSTGRTFLVAAKVGEAEGRPQLALVVVPAEAPGVHVEVLGELPFVPEIPHAALRLVGVELPAQAVLPGDGYARYIKPFRTVEDLHVNGAVGAYLLAHATREGWPTDLRERLYFALLGLRALSHLPPSAPETHVALAGALSTLHEILEGLEPHFRGEAQERWQRDRALFKVAQKARTARRERAWNVLQGMTPETEGAQD